MGREQNYDVIVVGLGAMGSAAACHLARRGARVLGVEQFTPTHALGSSHGETRLIRELYFEHPLYVPLVQRAFELWDQLEQDAGTALQRGAGCITIGRPDSALLTGTLRSAVENRLPAEQLSAHEVRRRFPALMPTDDQVGVYDPRAAILFPEACVRAHLELATRAGAELCFDEMVEAWSATSDVVTVKTRAGTHNAGRLLFTAGAWTGQLLPGLELPLVVERQVVHWFQPRRNPEQFTLGRFPVFIAEHDPVLYGFPDLGSGVKLALHHGGKTFNTPQQVQREVVADDVESVRSASAGIVPYAAGELIHSLTCIYTNTPDSHFLIDIHPEFANVLIVSPCSGHGFKFASVMGEVLADLVLEPKLKFDLAAFGVRRFTAGL